MKFEDREITHRAIRVLLEKTNAPIEVILDAQQQITSLIKFRVDGLILKIKTVWSDLPAEAIEVLEEQTVATMNECANVQPDL